MFHRYHSTLLILHDRGCQMGLGYRLEVGEVGSGEKVEEGA
jgi:hypothetical protein